MVKFSDFKFSAQAIEKEETANPKATSKSPAFLAKPKR
jgi:hypothetical protein